MTVHELLIADHGALRQQAAELQSALRKNPGRVGALFERFRDAVREHLRKEDTFYYPALDGEKQVANRELMHALRNDHAGVLFALESLTIKLRQKIPMAEWKKKLDTMLAVLLPHFKQEEENLFPLADELLGPEKMKTLLAQMQTDPS